MKAVAHRRRHRRQHGYVLVTVLLAMVLLALVAARLDGRLALFRDATGQWDRWLQGQADLAGARDELLFAMTTRPLTPLGFAGTPMLPIDGRPVRLASGARASVQDMRGLVSVVAFDPAVMRRLLVARGLADREVEPLLDKLADYADLDELRRLNGGERADYAQAGLPPPRDDWPLSPYELRLVLGWHTHPALWERASDLFTAVREGVLNPNTAPPAILAALPGTTPEAVRTLMGLREQGLHVASSAMLLALTGIVQPDNPVAFHPGLFYRLRLWRPGDARAVEYTVMLAPDSPSVPWLVLETRQIPRPTDDDDARDPPLLRTAPAAAAAGRSAP